MRCFLRQAALSLPETGRCFPNGFFARTITKLKNARCHGINHAVATLFCRIGNCVITPRRLVELKKIQRNNRREDGCGHCPLFCRIGNCVITPRRLVELKKIQRNNRREDGCGHCPLFHIRYARFCLRLGITARRAISDIPECFFLLS